MYMCTSLHDPHHVGQTQTPDPVCYSRVVAVGSHVLLGFRLARITGVMSSISAPADGSADGQ